MMSVLDIFSMANKKGFITGAARGIGKCLAEAFVDAGADLAVVDIDDEAAQKAAEEIWKKYGRKVAAIGCNVTDAADVEKMMEVFLNEFGSIDFAINNAGISTLDNAMDISESDFKKVIDVNLNGVFLTAQAAARTMKAQGKGGSIVSTASISGHIVNIPQTIANYCAAKAGVMQLTKALAVEWAQYGIRVNSVSPGYMLTELIRDASEMHPVWEAKVPLKRLGRPVDLVGAYLFLASDASIYATGSDIVVDGGYVCL
ncbi:SDR family oxidoreductase [Petroclostridium sp. X23]|uniref:SDR family oxidoreductase n=1 Tax=Petroclostridium sp. X23 TaxID=3045146 RepID=UPI0024ADE446|nr:SDR family oxidoreductase [Petroclostridium sp. X23]WHH60509.1 SDR family oxidoreductase [Petroclostridium sp. X23]